MKSGGSDDVSIKAVVLARRRFLVGEGDAAACNPNAAGSSVLVPHEDLAPVAAAALTDAACTTTAANAGRRRTVLIIFEGGCSW
mmetsp:Transcript_33225/g.67024  ORF Transcript_33225/g.67024 Transcript_33225/m.67024 type:complete len:84 (+) Transcript_33225:822-1073(+)